jgi:hypothetical protein
MLQHGSREGSRCLRRWVRCAIRAGIWARRRLCSGLPSCPGCRTAIACAPGHTDSGCCCCPRCCYYRRYRRPRLGEPPPTPCRSWVELQTAVGGAYLLVLPGVNPEAGLSERILSASHHALSDVRSGNPQHAVRRSAAGRTGNAQQITDWPAVRKVCAVFSALYQTVSASKHAPAASGKCVRARTLVRARTHCTAGRAGQASRAADEPHRPAHRSILDSQCDAVLLLIDHGASPISSEFPAVAQQQNSSGGDSMYKSSILSLGFSPFTPHSNLN